MDEKIATIKTWLGTGSINIFGLPFSGKDTVGVRLAEVLGARFLSAGMILRDAAQNDLELGREMAQGKLADTQKFRDIILPYFSRDDLRDSALVLSSVGRWDGEETDVIASAAAANHPIKAALLLNISEAEVFNRWVSLKDNTSDPRGLRSDDRDEATIRERLDEFHVKTMPVILTYRSMDLLVSVFAHASKDQVFENVIDALYDKAVEKEDREVLFTEAE